jgi:uncharacterized membrane protein YfcA
MIEARALLASPFGFLTGLSLGTLGGGGSILAVPALVYVVGLSATSATATSLAVVAVTAVWALARHHRAGHVRVAPGILFALAGIGGSVVGSVLNQRVDPDVLLLGFAAVMLAAAAGMVRRARGRLGAGDEPIDAGTEPADRGDAATVRVARRIDARMIAGVMIGGTIVGFLTGLFGVGGGFVIVPMLVLVLGFSMRDAVGTSLLVIAISSAIARVPRIGTDAIDPAVTVAFTLAALAGATLGTRVATRVDPTRLVTWFGGLLVAVALYTGISSINAL